MTIWKLGELVRHVAAVQALRADGRWVPARPVDPSWVWKLRLRGAWLVLTGRADAVIWPRQR